MTKYRQMIDLCIGNSRDHYPGKIKGNRFGDEVAVRRVRSQDETHESKRSCCVDDRGEGGGMVGEASRESADDYAA